VHEGTKGGESTGSESRRRAAPGFRVLAREGVGGGGEKAVGSSFVSRRMIWLRDVGCSHGGGTMLARRCFLRSRASQRGSWVRCGGLRTGVLPCGHEGKQGGQVSSTSPRRYIFFLDSRENPKRTLSREMLSSRWRGTTVTISISARYDTSAWVSPGGSGRAIVIWVEGVFEL